MKTSHILFVILIAAAAGFGGAKLAGKTQSVNQVEHKETTFERVARTGVLRCAYMLWDPFMMKDPNTGKFKGMNYDMMNAVAASLGLKADWALEIPPGTQAETLTSGKADAICSGEGPIVTSAALYEAYTAPLAYFPFYAYVRTDDKRFKNNDVNRLNSDDVTITVIDGDVSGEAQKTKFPKAHALPLPQLADPSQMMLNVISRKADFVLNDELSMADFLKNNPGKLRKLETPPIIVVPNTFSTARSELALADLLTQGLKTIRDRGVFDQILAKYGIGTEIKLYSPALPYMLPTR